MIGGEERIWFHRRSSSSLWLVGPRIHDVLFLSRLFLDMLDLRHVLDIHYLVVSPLSLSISTSGLSFGCIRLLLTMYL